MTCAKASRRSSWGLWWCLWWGLGARVGVGPGGPGERRADGVRVFSANAQHDIQEAPPSNQIESPGAFLRLQVQRAVIESVTCHSRIRPDEIWVSKSPRSAIPDVSASHHITQTPLRFSRGTTSANASQPTCRGSALDRSALGDFKATQQEILGSNNLQGKRRTIST
jgi:hypothetical protein